MKGNMMVGKKKVRNLDEKDTLVRMNFKFQKNLEILLKGKQQLKVRKLSMYLLNS